MSSILENRGVVADALPLRAKSKIPTVAEARVETPDADESWFGHLEYSQPWNIADHSVGIVGALAGSLSDIAMHQKSAGFPGSFDNALDTLPEAGSEYLFRYRALGVEVMNALQHGGDLTVAQLSERLETLHNEGASLMHHTVNTAGV